MSILAECHVCHRKQANKNRKCLGCGENLIKAKKAKRVTYWITYRVNGKQRRESVGRSLTDAQAADGKRKAQKREGRILEILPDSKITFNELAAWYQNQKSVQNLKSFDVVYYSLKNVSAVLGSTQVNKIKLEDWQNYQYGREAQGKALETIDK